MSIVLKLTLAGSKRLLRGQAHYWRAMREQSAESGRFSVASIDMVSNADRGDIRKFIRGLAAAGFVEPAGEIPMVKGAPEKLYRIIRNQAECPRLTRNGSQQTGQRNMWNLLRGPMGRDGITARDLAAFASTEDVPVSIETAKAYLKTLARADYLACLVEGGPKKLAVWRLKPAMNTGPLPPMILRSKLVYDQNSDRVIGEVLAEEEPS